MSNEATAPDYNAFKTAHGDAHAALLALGKSVDDGGLEKELTELVKLRVSQMNGCAFCVQYHLNITRDLGVAEAKLDLAAAWREAGVFSDRETAALRWAECLTRPNAPNDMEAEWVSLRKHFNENDATLLTITIGAINAWNRIGVGLRFAPPILQKGAA